MCIAAICFNLWVCMLGCYCSSIHWDLLLLHLDVLIKLCVPAMPYNGNDRVYWHVRQVFSFLSFFYSWKMQLGLFLYLKCWDVLVAELNIYNKAKCWGRVLAAERNIPCMAKCWDVYAAQLGVNLNIKVENYNCWRLILILLFILQRCGLGTMTL